MGINGFIIIGKYLFLVILEEVESNVIGIGLNCVGEEFNLELDVKRSDELERQSESPGEDKNFYNFFWNHEL